MAKKGLRRKKIIILCLTFLESVLFLVELAECLHILLLLPDIPNYKTKARCARVDYVLLPRSLIT